MDRLLFKFTNGRQDVIMREDIINRFKGGIF